MLTNDVLVFVGELMCMYLLHSTLLILIAWLASRWIPTGTRLRSGLWKSAVVLPLLTVALQPFVPAKFNWTNMSWEYAASDAELPADSRAKMTEPVVPLPTEAAPGSEFISVPENPVTISVTEPILGDARPPAPPLAETLPNPDGDWIITVRPAPAEVEPLPAVLPDHYSVSEPAIVLMPSEVFPQAVDQPVEPVAPESPRITFRQLLWWIGVAGICSLLFGILKCLWDVWLVVREINKATPLVNLQFANQLRQLRQKYGITQHVELLTACQCTEPAACGIWSWTILIPDGVAEQLPSDQVRALLAHELAHLVRRDTLWLWLGRVLLCCLPWQPLNRIAFHNWRTDEEFLADEWALQRGVQPLALANCLTNVAQWRLSGPACPGVPASSESLTERVMRLVDGQTQQRAWSRTWSAHATAILLVAGICSGITAGPRIISVPSHDYERMDHVAEPLSEQALRERLSEMLSSVTDEQRATRHAVTASDDDLRHEIEALTADLNVALTLIAERHQTSEIDQLVARLQARIADLQTRLHELDTASQETP
ncbi:MAG: hypothetical protein KDA69_07610 [Planctomycetaceae bacterium]|nr:hypothetical protein [Planctomycetaceae bacterium]